MNDNNPYIVYEYKGKSEFSVVDLAENVLGGNDAMNFTSAIQNLKQGDTKYLIVNLTNVKLMNSSGLGMLVGGLRALQKNDITLVLAGVPEKVQELLRITHLYKVFKTYGNIEAAVNDLE